MQIITISCNVSSATIRKYMHAVVIYCKKITCMHAVMWNIYIMFIQDSDESQQLSSIFKLAASTIIIPTASVKQFWVSIILTAGYTSLSNWKKSWETRLLDCVVISIMQIDSGVLTVGSHPNRFPTTTVEELYRITTMRLKCSQNVLNNHKDIKNIFYIKTSVLHDNVALQVNYIVQW